MTDDITTLRAQLDSAQQEIERLKSGTYLRELTNRCADANEELQRRRGQSLGSLHGLVEDLRTAVNAMREEVASLAELTTESQRDTVETRNRTEHAVATILDLIRSLPCRSNGGNGHVCQHDHRSETDDTLPPPPRLPSDGFPEQ